MTTTSDGGRRHEEMTASIAEIAKNAEQASTVAGMPHICESSNETIGQLERPPTTGG
jgi:hypothetical protein